MKKLVIDSNGTVFFEGMIKGEWLMQNEWMKKCDIILDGRHKGITAEEMECLGDLVDKFQTQTNKRYVFGIMNFVINNVTENFYITCADSKENIQ